MGTTPELTKTDETPPKQPTSYRWKVGATFLASLPVMWLIGYLGIFFLGFGIWIIPWLLGGFVGTALLPQGPLATEFDGPTIAFAFFAAIQNALIVWFYLKRKTSSKFIQIAFWILVSVTIAGAITMLVILITSS